MRTKQIKKRQNHSELVYSIPASPVQIVIEVKERLKRYFKNHIGESQAVTPEQIFEAVFKCSVFSVDLYKREYLWNVIKKVLNLMRREAEVFVINKHNLFFVVKEINEAEYYEKILNRDIDNMNKAITRCYEYVEQQKWKKLIDKKETKEKKVT